MLRPNPKIPAAHPYDRSTLRAGALLVAGIVSTTLFSACMDSGGGNAVPGPDGPDSGAGRLQTLLYNPKWYRTLDSSHSISISQGTLLFAWTFRDPLHHPDSFSIGIDTLWLLPQNVRGDTSPNGDWDLQICPDGLCQGGLAAGIDSFNSPAHFGGTGEFANLTYETEHHFQFFPAIDTANGFFRFTAPDSSLFGALLYVRPRSGKGPTDTVFGFGAWKLPWDSAYPPPVRPVNGYRPKRSDFEINAGTVRYIGP